jgi:glutathione peroxidase
MYSKISVAGDDQHPLYAALIAAQPSATGEGPFRERLAGKNLGGEAPGMFVELRKVRRRP